MSRYEYPFYLDGLVKCFYKAPIDPGGCAGVLWASESEDLYFYSNCFFWGDFVTVRKPIVSFYIQEQVSTDPELLNFNDHYQDGIPTWQSLKYRLRYSIVLQGWILQDKLIGSSEIPYIPQRSWDIQKYNYGWYFASNIDQPFEGYCMSAQSEDKTLVITYAMKKVSPLVYDIDATKEVSQSLEEIKSTPVNFGYLVVRLQSSGLTQDLNLYCYYANVFDNTHYTQYKLVNSVDGSLVATIVHQDNQNFTLTLNSGTPVSISGTNLDTTGTNVLSYQDQTTSYTITLQFTGQRTAGKQRMSCYYGEVATWH